MAGKEAKPLAKKPRIATFDLLRGYFLVSIILNHLDWYPSGLDWVAVRGSLFVSAAEGFFLISGILLGIVRGRKLLKKPFRVVAQLVLHRGAVLYITSIVLMLLFTFIGWHFLDNPGLKPGIRPPDQSLTDILMGALSFQYLYGWADFLRLYAIFLFMSPFALWLLRKGCWYIVLAGSIILWSLYPYAFEHTTNSAELLMPLSWQLIFFVGLIIGFHWIDIETWWNKLSKKTRSLLLNPILIIAGVTLIGNIVLAIVSGFGGAPNEAAHLYNTLLSTLFDKDGLPIFRLILFGFWFILGFTFVKRYEKYIIRLFGWILLPFGKNSLYVYTLHAILLFFAHLLITPGTQPSMLISFIGSIAILGIILLAIHKEFLFKIIPR